MARRRRKKRQPPPRAPARPQKPMQVPGSVRFAQEQIALYQLYEQYDAELKLYRQALKRLGNEDPKALEEFNRHLRDIAIERGYEVAKVDEVEGRDEEE